MTTQSIIDSSWTINEVIARNPETISVFNSLGMDTCCGGHESIAAAANEAGLDADAIVSALLNASARTAEAV